MSSGIGLTATEDRIESILTRQYRYTVPDYQRRYAWGEEQWAALWSDIQAIEEGDTHFVGSIVLIERSQGLNDLDQLEVVDGQQRLTTISLILAVMRQKYLNEDLEKQADSINNKYLWQEDIDTARYPNLSLSKFDDDDYRAILDQRFDEVSDSNLREGFQFYAEKMDELDPKEINEIRNKLLRSVTAVSITTDGEQSAFRLFETLNDRGLELSAVDLMKNYVFSTAATDPSIDYDQIRDDWEAIVELIVPKLSKPSRFFRHYIMSASEPDHDGDVSDYKLYDTFQDIVDNKLDQAGISLEEYVADMLRSASIYADLIDHSVSKYDSNGNAAVNDKLDDLEMLSITQARTILLRIIDELESANRVMEALRVLEAFVIRWKTANYPTGGEIDRIYSRACSEYFDDESEVADELRDLFTDRWPSDGEFRTSLENKRMRLNDQTKYMLIRIEEDYYNGSQVEFSEPEREHIAPRAAFSAKKYSAWPVQLDMTEGEFMQVRDRLGNLTLFESDRNASVGADPFENKKEVYSTSEYEMTKAIATDYDEWSGENIDNRTRELAQACVNIWSL
ncbi:DUF262 domain-containing protein [Halobaculum magnesiiphilum]|uniref:DUF262 domain-containing HNH endonuclease family protein n=1 Tax=Halobaculum magnesiiphilum TaxID=1017351 RepID=A0A8T8WH40_9EURY|nr:DUF262 domain-containing protein [Halobaculum magnesiiphilum]QZP39192.1 DUF262 domain-containing HNH endonuclease family protein [Halobaculum magnesiiphilum]